MCVCMEVCGAEVCARATATTYDSVLAWSAATYWPECTPRHATRN